MSDPLRRVTPVVRLAPAKLNLTLAITGRREDGFHALHSVMVPLGLADRLAIAPAFASADRLHVTGARAADLDPAGLGPDDLGRPDPGRPGLGRPDTGPADRNLVLTAITVARAACRAKGVDVPLPALAARLDKRIPVGAGLGGGSSDGAAALTGALEAWGMQDVLTAADLATAAASLGSDVPFFLAGGWALVEGRGERVARLPAPRGAAPAVLLVTPGLAVSTADVFAAYATGARPAPGAALASSRHLAGELVAGITHATFAERAGILAVSNDLAAATAAVVPGFVPFRRALGRLVERPVGQSGSGPTVWVLYASIGAAEAAAIRVREAIAAHDLPIPGERPPFVEAAPIMAGDPVAAAGADRQPDAADKGGA
jgi:4-diphosphocytidyl-2-C-methyl-D-erythritol kinase